MAKPIFYLAGHKKGLPTLEDILALSKALTGRDATPEEIEAAKTTLALSLVSSRRESACPRSEYDDQTQAVAEYPHPDERRER